MPGRHGSTLVVSTSDHESGGLGVGRNEPGWLQYAWYPEVIDRVPHSTETLRIMADDAAVHPCDLLAGRFEIMCTEDERRTISATDTLGVWDRERAIGRPIAREAAAGWTTSGHTGADVAVYAFGPGSDMFRGLQDNTRIARNIADILGFDLDEMTAQLRASKASD